MRLELDVRNHREYRALHLVCFFLYKHTNNKLSRFHLKDTHTTSLWHIQIVSITTLGSGAITKYNKGHLTQAF